MQFDKSRIYSAVNADELRAGDKVCVADTLMGLENRVRHECVAELEEVLPDYNEHRFKAYLGIHNLAYLVERKENCTNCGAIYTCAFQVREHPELEKCKNWKPKTEPKAEPHFRPFKNIDELVKVWVEKTKPYRADTRIPPLIMPLIWVRYKFTGNIFLINAFWKDIGDGEGDSVDIGCYRNVYVDKMLTYHDDSRDGEDGMADGFEFLDGTPCGVRE